MIRPNKFLNAILPLIIFNILFFNSPQVQGQEEKSAALSKLSFESFKKIAILDAGRIKPLDSFAQSILLQFSGRRSFDRKPAIEWLAKLFFTPELTQNDKIFLANHPDVPLALGIAPESKRRYSFEQVVKNYHKLAELAMKASQIDEKKRTIVENEFMRLFENVETYLKLSQGFQFVMPHPDFSITDPLVRRYLEIPNEQSEFSFLDIALNANKLMAVTDFLEKKKKEDWTSSEQQSFRLVTNLLQWSTHYQNMVPNIIALRDKDSRWQWVSPWDIVAQGFLDDKLKNEIIGLRDLAGAYQHNDRVAFEMAAHAFEASVTARVEDVRALKYIPLEIRYNRLNLFLWAFLFYLIALIVLIISFFSKKKVWHGLGLAAVALGFIPHLSALVMRITIMGRPPVTSLYETFIFVSGIAVLMGLLIELLTKKWLGIMVSAVAGTILLIIANKFSTDGDTLKMLVAVLNSNFWLGIHVPNITMGYAACCVAAILGHIYIIQGLLNPKDRAQLATTYKTMLGVLAVGLMLSFFGTVLGGIWADQSWGRFWGWDPKENGALMIVLWCAIIFHARIAGILNPLGVATASSLLLLVVVWAWLGVNLLSVGLHSYGFTSGIATGFMVFVCGELLFLIVSVPIVSKKIT